MTKFQRFLFGVGALVVVAGQAHAVPTLTLTPALTIVAPGDVVTLELELSGLTGDALGVSTFDVDILFDDSLVSVVDYLVDPLAALDLFGELDVSFGEVAPGVFNVGFVSLTDPLIDPLFFELQPDTVLLALIDVKVSDTFPVGETPVGFEPLAIGDAFGDPLTVVSGDPAILRRVGVDLPGPATLPLVLAALGLVAPLRRLFRG